MPLVLVAEALIASAPSYPKVQTLLHDFYEDLILNLAQVLEREQPGASAGDYWVVIVATVDISLIPIHCARWSCLDATVRWVWP